MRSKDTGTGRKILAKVEVPLSVDDITVYALRYLDDIGDNDIQDTIIDTDGKFRIYANGSATDDVSWSFKFSYVEL